jgi:hypothetical protein
MAHNIFARIGKSALPVAFMTALSLATVLSTATIMHGSLSAGIAALRGNPIQVIGKDTKNLGSIAAGQSIAVRFVLRNLTRHPVKIVGSTTSCSCTVVDDLPTELKPSETRTLTMTVHFADEERGNFKQDVQLHTDSRIQPHISLSIVGDVSGR